MKSSTFWLRKNRGQIAKNFREVFAAFFAEDFEPSFAEVLAKGSPNLRSTREAVCALRQFSEIPSQNGCCGPSVRLLPSLHSQGTQVSRKVAGWLSY